MSLVGKPRANDSRIYVQRSLGVIGDGCIYELGRKSWTEQSRVCVSYLMAIAIDLVSSTFDAWMQAFTSMQVHHTSSHEH